MATIFNTIKKSVILSAMLAVANFANAQQVSVRDTVVVHDTVRVQTQSARQSIMNMAGMANSKGCLHNGIYGNNAENRAKGRVGKYWASNCNGFTFFGGPEVNISKATSEMGDFNNTTVGGRIGAGYDFYGIRPEVSYFKASNMDIEGCSFSSDEFKIALSYCFFKHIKKTDPTTGKKYTVPSKVSFGIGANYTTRLLKSTKQIETSKVSMTLPYSGRCGSFGVDAYVDFVLGHSTHNCTRNDGMYKYNYEKKGTFILRASVSYNPYKVEKLEGSALASTLKINQNFNTGIALFYRLP